LTLSQKVQKAAVWVVLASLVARGAQFIAEVILARMLMPEDFGLLATAMAIITFSEGTVITGFDSAIIQKQEKPESYLNTAWSIELLKNMILFIIIFSLAPLLGSFFNSTDVVRILQVLSLIFILQGLKNIGIIFFRKEMDFRRQFLIDTLPLVIYLVVVIPLVYSLGSVWALVYAMLARRIALVLFSYLFHPFRPRFEFKRGRVRGLLGFGKWIFLTSFVGMIREQGLIMFISKYLGVATLGIYNRAMVFSSLLFRELTIMVWKVGYPAYSKIQYDQEKLKQFFLKTLKMLTFVGTPLAGIIVVLSSDFAAVLLPAQWAGIAPVMRILAVGSYLAILNTPAGIVFQATGKPVLSSRVATMGLMTIALLVYPATRQWGLVGVAGVLLTSVVIVTPISFILAKNIVGFTSIEYLRPIAMALVNTGIMLAVIYLVRNYPVIPRDVFGLLLLVLSASLSYLAISLLYERFLNYRVYKFFLDSAIGFYQLREK